MTTKSAFITAMGGAGVPFGPAKVFTRTASDVLTATAHGLETGAGPYKVMTAAADAPAGLVAAVFASTFMTGTTMIATDVLVVDGKSYTIEAAPADDGDVDLGDTDAETAANLAEAINQLLPAAASSYDLDTAPLTSVVAAISGAGASGAAAILTLRAATLDATLGNAIEVSSVDGTMIVDNATMENGADGTDYYIIRLTADTFSVATSKANALAGTVVAITDAGTGVHQLVPTVETLAESLEDVVVNFLTYQGARVLPADHNIAKFWQSAIDGTAAGDQA